MNKLILFFSLFFLSTASGSCIVSDIHFTNVFYNAHALPQGVSGAYTFKGSETPKVQAYFFWDLNGVIFEKRYSIKGMLNQTAVTKKYGWKQTFSLLNDFRKLYQQKRAFRKAGDPRGFVWNAMFDYLEKESVQYNASLSNKELAQLLREFSQEANHLDYELIHLLEKLEQHGHKNVVLSNMGQGLVDLQVAHLEKELAATSAGTQKHTDLVFAISFLKQQNNVIASESNGWLHKPQRRAYERCLELNSFTAKDSSTKYLRIFIDDKQENIDAALAEGLFDIGINYKNPKDLRRIMYYIFPHFVDASSSKKIRNHTAEF